MGGKRGIFKYISFCLSWALLMITVMPVLTVSDEKVNTVKIGYFSEPGMMNGAEEGADKSGYAYECLQEIAAHAGWKYSYVYGEFDDLYEMLLKGEIDMLPFITATEERRQQMLFPEEEIADESFYLASVEGMLVSNDYHELNGKRIGSMEGYFQNDVLYEFLEEYDLDCEIVMFTDHDVKWNAIENGDIDITVESSITMHSINLSPICKVGDSYPVYAAIAKNRSDLLEQFNMSRQEIDSENPGFWPSLSVKYFKDAPLFKSISLRGRQWIEEHEVLRVGTYNNDAPLAYEDKDGNITGVMPDYINRMFRNYGLDLSVEWVFYSSNAEALEGLYSGQIDAIHPYYPSYNLAERNGVVISTSVYSSLMSILYEGPYTADTMKRVATPDTRLGAYYVADNYPDSIIIPCEDGYDCIEKMLSGEADCVIMNSSALKRIASTYNKEFNIKTLHSMCDTCFATLPENSAIIDIINSTSTFLSDEEVNAIEAGYYVEADNVVTMKQFLDQHPGIMVSGVAFIVAVIASLIFLAYRRRIERAQRMVLEEARNAADAANRSKTTFLFNMSHDIRTPMNAILGFTDIGLKNVDDIDKSQDCYEKIKVAGGHLLNLINDILEMSRIESGKLEITETPMDIRIVSRNIHYMSTTTAEQKNIDLKIEIGELKNPYLYADNLYISEILINLISNAVKYTPEGGWVKYCVNQISDIIDNRVMYRFEISDNGIGMSEEFQKHLYEAFSREQNSTVSKIEGTGLGLSIVKKIVDVLGGTINVKSKQGEGSTFVVELPFRVMDDAAIEQMKADILIHNEALEKISFTGKKVLVVEDNELNREIAKEILEDDGFVVDMAEDGSVAVEKIRDAKEGDYDVILMDIQMPIMDGYEATRAIRTIGNKVSKIPILAMTANAFEEDRKAAIEAGMNEHIAKPIKVDELKETLVKFL